MGYLKILHFTFTAESDSERILKVGQHSPKLWAIKYRVVFLMKHGVETAKSGFSRPGSHHSCFFLNRIPLQNSKGNTLNGPEIEVV